MEMMNSMHNPDLPAEIGSRVRLQSADTDGIKYLEWRGFGTETVEVGGYCVMRRDFHDGTFSHNPEPSPPRFSIIVL